MLCNYSLVVYGYRYVHLPHTSPAWQLAASSATATSRCRRPPYASVNSLHGPAAEHPSSRHRHLRRGDGGLNSLLLRAKGLPVRIPPKELIPFRPAEPARPQGSLVRILAAHRADLEGAKERLLVPDAPANLVYCRGEIIHDRLRDHGVVLVQRVARHKPANERGWRHQPPGRAVADEAKVLLESRHVVGSEIDGLQIGAH
mmetsp:Transcript_1414/g.6175  ORF Transcript_1414/g.6175 Transcript_1414/m.6175 type:complete len:201 (-) Transcript_1414:1968-2570(-)